MKRILLLSLALCGLMTAFAQTDTTAKQAPDTIKIGGMVIIREAGSNKDTVKTKDRILQITRRRGDRESNVSTNWWIVDLGFSNWNDKTNYASADAQAIAPGSNEDWLKLRGGKSRSVNIWMFMQRINMIEHVVNLKYGLGLELNNYFFDDKSIKFNKTPTRIDRSYTNLSKNKLAADYVTMPVMLNFNFTPNRSRGFGFSAGVSAGYLYSARQKVKESGDKDKTKSDFDLRKWKLSYVGEVSLGYVKLYGSYAFKSMFEKGLDLTPYNVGLRLSAW